MIRRAFFSICAITALGLAALPSGGLAQQTADMDGVKATSKAFYTALSVFDDGEAMGKVFAQTPYITYVGPRSKTIIVGWEGVKKSIAENNKLFSERNVSLSDAKIHINGNVAWELGHETGGSKMKNGTVGKTDWIATNIYEKQSDGRWLMVSHHVQPKPQ